MEDKKDWFASWFNTSYYHTLYKDRNYTEAKEFVRNLISFLKFQKGDKLLDLACGKGRHSIFLNSLGFDIVGADLSKNSIAHAKQFENKTLHFIEHDMREPFHEKFDAVLNLFTSFGFFEDDNEDIAILRNIKNGLKQNGVAIIDFMNSRKVISNLVDDEIKTVDGIAFHINRYVKNGFVIKEINFEDLGQHHTYFEKVKCLDLNKINTYLNSVGFKIKYIFGNYELGTFNEDSSDRLILVLE